MASSSSGLDPLRAHRQPNRTASPVKRPANDHQQAYPAPWVVFGALTRGPKRCLILPILPASNPAVTSDAREVWQQSCALLLVVTTLKPSYIISHLSSFIPSTPSNENSRSTTFENISFEDVADRYGSRFKGLRWNHEYKPLLFKEGSEWEKYARDQDEAAYEDVQDNHRSEWNKWMDGIANNKPRDAYLNQGTARQLPWRSSAYQSVKKVYKHFFDFQCKAEARLVDILAGKLGSSRNLIIYPAQRTGAEYSINTDLVTASNAIREISTWDLHEYTNS